MLDRDIPDRVRGYVLHGLAATPNAMTALLHGVTAEELDARPFENRFTLREVCGHMADWEGVWLERIQLLATESDPFLPGYDEGQWAIDHDYAHADVSAQLRRLEEGRIRLVEFVKALQPAQWFNPGRHGEIGPITLFELLALILGHDGYHTRQIVDYRRLLGGNPQ